MEQLGTSLGFYPFLCLERVGEHVEGSPDADETEFVLHMASAERPEVRTEERLSCAALLAAGMLFCSFILS